MLLLDNYALHLIFAQFWRHLRSFLLNFCANLFLYFVLLACFAHYCDGPKFLDRQVWANCACRPESSLLDALRMVMHHSFVTTHPPHPNPQGIAGTLTFHPENPCYKPHTAGTNGKTMAVWPYSLLCFTVCSCNPHCFRLKNKTLALRGQCKNKNWHIFPAILRPAPRHEEWGEPHGYNWLVHKSTLLKF